MEIYLVSGKGSGPTELSAYDDALLKAGIEHNIIYLSSIIQAGAKIVKKQGVKLPGEYGDRLYAVVSHNSTSTKNSEAWAGLGCVQDAKTGAGLFVEHHASNEATIRKDIAQSLERLMEVRNRKFGPIQMLVEGVAYDGQPASAIVAAVFKAESW